MVTYRGREVRNLSSSALKTQQETKLHTVWIGEEDRIASFHAVKDYTMRTFECHDYFIHFLQTLQQRGFRFQ